MPVMAFATSRLRNTAHSKTVGVGTAYDEYTRRKKENMQCNSPAGLRK